MRLHINLMYYLNVYLRHSVCSLLFQEKANAINFLQKDITTLNHHNNTECFSLYFSVRICFGRLKYQNTMTIRSSWSSNTIGFIPFIMHEKPDKKSVWYKILIWCMPCICEREKLVCEWVILYFKCACHIRIKFTFRV